MARHFVGGFNGVGKSRVISEVVARDLGFERLHTTSLFMTHLGLPPGAYNQLRALPDEVKAVENNKMLDALLAEPPPLGVEQMLDSHYLNVVGGETTRLITGAWPRRLGSLVLITADVEILYERITQDAATRDRRLFAADATPGQQRDAIARYLAATAAEFKYVVAQAECPHVVIDNSGDPETAATRFLEFHASLPSNGTSALSSDAE